MISFYRLNHSSHPSDRRTVWQWRRTPPRDGRRMKASGHLTWARRSQAGSVSNRLAWTRPPSHCHACSDLSYEITSYLQQVNTTDRQRRGAQCTAGNVARFHSQILHGDWPDRPPTCSTKAPRSTASVPMWAPAVMPTMIKPGTDICECSTAWPLKQFAAVWRRRHFKSLFLPNVHEDLTLSVFLPLTILLLHAWCSQHDTSSYFSCLFIRSIFTPRALRS